jgi:hypothetical protein
VYSSSTWIWAYSPVISAMTNVPPLMMLSNTNVSRATSPGEQFRDSWSASRCHVLSSPSKTYTPPFEIPELSIEWDAPRCLSSFRLVCAISTPERYMRRVIVCLSQHNTSISTLMRVWCMDFIALGLDLGLRSLKTLAADRTYHISGPFLLSTSNNCFLKFSWTLVFVCSQNGPDPLYFSDFCAPSPPPYKP